MLVIHAPNIHTGGGKVLLLGLFEEIKTMSQCIVIIDNRLKHIEKEFENINFITIQPTIFHRLKAEYLLRQISSYASNVICFGNLPPLFKLKACTNLYLQNRYLVDNNVRVRLPLILRLRLWVEKMWLKTKIRNVDDIIVQTKTMQMIVAETLNRKSKVLPFLKVEKCISVSKDNAKEFDFVYISSGEPHKNHLNLIEAWILMAECGYRPSLGLTLNPIVFSKLCKWIEDKVQKYNLNITNLKEISHAEVMCVYKKSRALIYPSYFESFGIPIIEASELGLSVIAPEEDYIRDLVNPAQTFNPDSPLSISRAVCRFLSYNSEVQKLYKPSDLVHYISTLSIKLNNEK